MPTFREQAESGVQQIEAAIVGLLQEHRDGLRNFEIANRLGLESKQGEEQRNRLTWAILTRLVQSGRVRKVGSAQNVRYVCVD